MLRSYPSRRMTAPTVGSTSPALASAASSAVPTRSASIGESRFRPGASPEISESARKREQARSVVQSGPYDLDDRPESSRVGDDHGPRRAPQVEAVSRVPVGGH